VTSFSDCCREAVIDLQAAFDVARNIARHIMRQRRAGYAAVGLPPHHLPRPSAAARRRAAVAMACRRVHLLLIARARRASSADPSQEHVTTAGPFSFGVFSRSSRSTSSRPT
jgi:hypothetical protein